MREIKFRAWDSREKVMLSPEDVANGNYALGSHGLMVAHEKDSEHLWNVDHFLTPIFWTGLTDRNGKEIYDGDILKISDDADEFITKGKVEWLHDFWNVSEIEDSLYGLTRNGFIELIGNVHQHPELINS